MNKTTPTTPLIFLLYSGAVYFFCVAMVHSLGIKIPGLFVYFNVPSYAYQDRIISFLALGWSAFFFLSAKKLDPDMIKLILIIGLLAIIALSVNTLISDFKQMDTQIQKRHFLLIILGLFIYWLSLVIYSRALLGLKK
ncbi:hypothetical protein HQ531_10340 [bacterium]|nr:hypothetical protein [bacterium]